MLQPSSLGFNSASESANDLLEQFAVSLDNKFLRHKHIAAEPKLRKLLKVQSGARDISSTTTAYCSHCKKEAFVICQDGNGDRHSVSEKEVDVKKDLSGKSWEKKVHFLKESLSTKGETQEKADAKKVECAGSKGERKLDQHEIKGDSDSSTFPDLQHDRANVQPVFFARRPSIIGNNEFWLPKYSLSNPGLNEETSDVMVTEKLESTANGHQQENQVEASDDFLINSTQGQLDSFLCELQTFLGNILRQTSKRQVKILQVSPMLDDTYVALTDEHLFKCKDVGSTFEIVDAISLKDVQKIMVSETCTLLVLEVCHASSLTEFKEFVPGYSEKTESLISLMVYALSRIKHFLLDVIRLPLMDLPTCGAMQCWLAQQNEDIMYTEIGIAENVSQVECDLSEESFMLKIGEEKMFHPVLLLLRAGYLTSKCNGGCASRGCKYSVTLELKKQNVSGMRREDKPWPNCVRLITDYADITFAASSKASADDLLEKMYCCIQPTKQTSMKLKVFIIVTEHCLQLFKMDIDKFPVFGSPLLNLEIFDENVGGTSCIIDSLGVEADDMDLQSKTRWHLTFLSENEKRRFLTASSLD